MRPFIYILTFGLILFSCSQKRFEKLDGSWRLDSDGQIESPFFPFQIYFEGDSLILIDGYAFKHHARYQLIDDSIEMIFSNDIIRKLDFDTNSDSIIFLGARKFFRIPNDFSSNVKPYDLIDYKTNEILIDSFNSSVIHLVKIGGQVQVILNDEITDLESIPEFLKASHDSPQSLILYLGKGLEFNDLVEAYMWIKLSSSKLDIVSLVTGNDFFDKFYIVMDSISVDDSLMGNFLKREKIPSFSPRKIDITDKKRLIIEIKSPSDFEKLLIINDSTECLIKVDNQINLLGYLELMEKIRGKKNIKKVITAYNKW